MPFSNQLTELLGIDLPIIQAPMAGASGTDMAIAVSEAGGLGSLPCGMLTADTARAQLGVVRQQTNKPINMNFLCHSPAEPDLQREQSWRLLLDSYYEELSLDSDTPIPAANRAPFDAAMCEVVEEFQPEVVSFHFGLPKQSLLDRVRATGAIILSSATTVAEAVWLADHGCHAIIAQGYEAGGHRGNFLSDNITTQSGTMALVPQVVDAVSVPVVATGGISDGRGVTAAFALGASAVQVGTAYLFTPEALITDLHRQALSTTSDDDTALTNIFSGRPARGIVNRIMRDIGPMSAQAPAFPTAGGALAPLKAAAEAKGSSDFSSLWSGQAAGLSREMSAAELTQTLCQDAEQLLRALNLD